MSHNILYNQINSTRSIQSELCRTCLLLFFVVSIITKGYSQKGLYGEYYDGQNFERLIATRTDQTIDFTWYNEAPFDGMHPEIYSIRWTGKIKPPRDGSYEFSAAVDDGIRVWVDDKLIIENWQLNDMANINSSIKLKGGVVYNLKVEYFNAMREGEIKLYWEMPPEEDRSWWQALMSSTETELISSEYFSLPPNSEMNNEKLFEDETMASISSEPIAPPIKKNTKIAKSIKKKAPAKREEPAKTVAKTVEPKAAIPEKAAASYLPKTVKFNRKESKILESSYDELNKLAQFLLNKPQLILRIEGHTDNVGDAEKNLELSKRRAFAIARYLVKKDVPAKRIKAQGFGGSKPLFKSENGVYHPENRRVDFILEEH